MSTPERCLLLIGAALAIAGCDQAMSVQPARRPLQPSSFFQDGRSSRPLVEGTVAQGQLRLDEHLHRGVAGGGFAATFPFDVTAEVLNRGRERYDIFCAPCHDRAGTGRGVIVGRGYRMPPTFHLDRLRQASPGQLFDVVSRGVGAMPPYAEQIPVRDRWAIVAYLRALQGSRDVPVDQIPLDERRRLESEPP